MLTIFVVIDGVAHAHSFRSPFLPSVDDDFQGIVYWFDEWGVNPYDAAYAEGGLGDFSPEWN
jgi:hypothetical protein